MTKVNGNNKVSAEYQIVNGKKVKKHEQPKNQKQVFNNKGQKTPQKPNDSAIKQEVYKKSGYQLKDTKDRDKIIQLKVNGKIRSYKTVGTLTTGGRILVKELDKEVYHVVSHTKDNKLVMLKDDYAKNKIFYESTSSEHKVKYGKKNYVITNAKRDRHGRMSAVDENGKRVVLSSDGKELKTGYVEAEDQKDNMNDYIARATKGKSKEEAAKIRQRILGGNSSYANKGVLRFKASNGEVWYYDTKRKTYVKYADKEAQAIIKDLDKGATENWGLFRTGLGTDYELLKNTNAQIIDPEVLGKVNKHYSAEYGNKVDKNAQYGSGKYKTAYEAFLASEIGDDEVYQFNATLVKNNAITDQTRRNEILQTNLTKVGSRANRLAAADAASRKEDYQTLQDAAEEENKKKNYKAPFKSSDALQTYIYGVNKGDVQEVDDFNTTLIDPKEDMLDRDEIVKIKAETGALWAKQGKYDKAFEAQDSEVVDKMFALQDANGKASLNLKELKAKAKGYQGEYLMFAKPELFTEQELADKAVQLLNIALDNIREYENVSPYVDDSLMGQNKARNLSQIQKSISKAYTLIRNDKVLNIVKQKMGDKFKLLQKKEQEKFGTDTFANVTVKNDSVKSNLSAEEVAQNKYVVSWLKSQLEDLERDKKLNEAKEGWKQSAVNSVRAEFRLGETRESLANKYDLIKSNMARLEAAAEGKLVDKNGKPVSFEDAMKGLGEAGIQALEKANQDYQSAQAKGEFVVDMAVLAIPIPGLSAGNIVRMAGSLYKVVGTSGKMYKVVKVTAEAVKGQKIINYAVKTAESSATGAMHMAGKTVALDASNIATSREGFTADRVSEMNEKTKGAALFGGMGGAIGGTTGAVAEFVSSKGAKYAVHTLGLAADVAGAAGLITAESHGETNFWDNLRCVNPDGSFNFEQASMTAMMIFGHLHGMSAVRGKAKPQVELQADGTIKAKLGNNELTLNKDGIWSDSTSGREFRLAENKNGKAELTELTKKEVKARHAELPVAEDARANSARHSERSEESQETSINSFKERINNAKSRDELNAIRSDIKKSDLTVQERNELMSESLKAQREWSQAPERSQIVNMATEGEMSAIGKAELNALRKNLGIKQTQKGSHFEGSSNGNDALIYEKKGNEIVNVYKIDDVSNNAHIATKISSENGRATDVEIYNADGTVKEVPAEAKQTVLDALNKSAETDPTSHSELVSESNQPVTDKPVVAEESRVNTESHSERSEESQAVPKPEQESVIASESEAIQSKPENKATETEAPAEPNVEYYNPEQMAEELGLKPSQEGNQITYSDPENGHPVFYEVDSNGNPVKRFIVSHGENGRPFTELRETYENGEYILGEQLNEAGEVVASEVPEGAKQSVEVPERLSDVNSFVEEYPDFVRTEVDGRVIIRNKNANLSIEYEKSTGRKVAGTQIDQDGLVVRKTFNEDGSVATMESDFVYEGNRYHEIIDMNEGTKSYQQILDKNTGISAEVKPELAQKFAEGTVDEGKFIPNEGAGVKESHSEAPAEESRVNSESHSERSEESQVKTEQKPAETDPTKIGHSERSEESRGSESNQPATGEPVVAEESQGAPNVEPKFSESNINFSRTHEGFSQIDGNTKDVPDLRNAESFRNSKDGVGVVYLPNENATAIVVRISGRVNDNYTIMIDGKVPEEQCRALVKSLKESGNNRFDRRQVADILNKQYDATETPHAETPVEKSNGTESHSEAIAEESHGTEKPAKAETGVTSPFEITADKIIVNGKEQPIPTFEEAQKTLRHYGGKEYSIEADGNQLILKYDDKGNFVGSAEMINKNGKALKDIYRNADGTIDHTIDYLYTEDGMQVVLHRDSNGKPTNINWSDKHITFDNEGKASYTINDKPGKPLEKPIEEVFKDSPELKPLLEKQGIKLVQEKADPAGHSERSEESHGTEPKPETKVTETEGQPATDKPVVGENETPKFEEVETNEGLQLRHKVGDENSYEFFNPETLKWEPTTKQFFDERVARDGVKTNPAEKPIAEPPTGEPVTGNTADEAAQIHNEEMNNVEPTSTAQVKNLEKYDIMFQSKEGKAFLDEAKKDPNFGKTAEERVPSDKIVKDADGNIQSIEIDGITYTRNEQGKYVNGDSEIRIYEPNEDKIYDGSTIDKEITIDKENNKIQKIESDDMTIRYDSNGQPESVSVLGGKRINLSTGDYSQDYRNTYVDPTGRVTTNNVSIDIEGRKYDPYASEGYRYSDWGRDTNGKSIDYELRKKTKSDLSKQIDDAQLENKGLSTTKKGRQKAYDEVRNQIEDAYNNNQISRETADNLHAKLNKKAEANGLETQETPTMKAEREALAKWNEQVDALKENLMSDIEKVDSQVSHDQMVEKIGEACKNGEIDMERANELYEALETKAKSIDGVESLAQKAKRIDAELKAHEGELVPEEPLGTEEVSEAESAGHSERSEESHGTENPVISEEYPNTPTKPKQLEKKTIEEVLGDEQAPKTADEAKKYAEEHEDAEFKASDDPNNCDMLFLDKDYDNIIYYNKDGVQAYREYKPSEGVEQRDTSFYSDGTVYRVETRTVDDNLRVEVYDTAGNLRQKELYGYENDAWTEHRIDFDAEGNMAGAQKEVYHKETYSWETTAEYEYNAEKNVFEQKNEKGEVVSTVKYDEATEHWTEFDAEGKAIHEINKPEPGVEATPVEESHGTTEESAPAGEETPVGESSKTVDNKPESEKVEKRNTDGTKIPKKFRGRDDVTYDRMTKTYTERTTKDGVTTERIYDSNGNLSREVVGKNTKYYNPKGDVIAEQEITEHGIKRTEKSKDYDLDVLFNSLGDGEKITVKYHKDKKGNTAEPEEFIYNKDKKVYESKDKDGKVVKTLDYDAKNHSWTIKDAKGYKLDSQNNMKNQSHKMRNAAIALAAAPVLYGVGELIEHYENDNEDKKVDKPKSAKPAPKKTTPAPKTETKVTLGDQEGTIDGNGNLKIGDKTYPKNEDGTYTIDDKKYKLEDGKLVEVVDTPNDNGKTGGTDGTDGTAEVKGTIDGKEYTIKDGTVTIDGNQYDPASDGYYHIGNAKYTIGADGKLVKADEATQAGNDGSQASSAGNATQTGGGSAQTGNTDATSQQTGNTGNATQTGGSAQTGNTDATSQQTGNTGNATQTGGSAQTGNTNTTGSTNTTGNNTHVTAPAQPADNSASTRTTGTTHNDSRANSARHSEQSEESRRTSNNTPVTDITEPTDAQIVIAKALQDEISGISTQADVQAFFAELASAVKTGQITIKQCDELMNQVKIHVNTLVEASKARKEQDAVPEPEFGLGEDPTSQIISNTPAEPKRIEKREINPMERMELTEKIRKAKTRDDIAKIQQEMRQYKVFQGRKNLRRAYKAKLRAIKHQGEPNVQKYDDKFDKRMEKIEKSKVYEEDAEIKLRYDSFFGSEDYDGPMIG